MRARGPLHGPIGEVVPRQGALAARPAGGLMGARVALSDNTKPGAVQILRRIGELRKRRSRWFDRVPTESVRTPIADDSEDIVIVVAGGPGRHSAFLSTWGYRTQVVTRQIRLPAGGSAEFGARGMTGGEVPALTAPGCFPEVTRGSPSRTCDLIVRHAPSFASQHRSARAASLSLLLLVLSSTPAMSGESRDRNPLETPDQPECEVYSKWRCDPQAEKLMLRGVAFEKRAKAKRAICVYRKIIREYPTALWDDDIMGGTYSGNAQDRINILTCQSARRREFSAQSAEGIWHAIRPALQNKDAKALARLASCDFTVGPAESDYFWRLLPEQVAPLLADLGLRLDWSSVSFQGRGQLTDRRQRALQDVIVTTRTGGDAHGFALEGALGRWRWVGYHTSEREMLDRLAKIERLKR